MLDRVDCLSLDSRYQEALETYLHLDQRIKRVEQDKQNLVEHYQLEPTIHSNWMWDTNGEKIHYGSMEAKVISYVDTCAHYDDLLASLIVRRDLFNEWLKTLTEQSMHILGRGIAPELDQQAMLQVREIEKQVPAKYRF